MRKIMKINDSSLKDILINAKKHSYVVTDLKAQQLIEGALEKLDKKTNVKRVIFNLKQDINMYTVAHGYKQPETLTKLQLLLDKDPDKWAGAGETLLLTNFQKNTFINLKQVAKLRWVLSQLI